MFVVSCGCCLMECFAFVLAEHYSLLASWTILPKGPLKTAPIFSLLHPCLAAEALHSTPYTAQVFGEGFSQVLGAGCVMGCVE